MSWTPVVRCPACGSAERASDTRTNRRYPLAHCLSCGTAFLDPRPVGTGPAELYPTDYYAYEAPPPITLYGRGDTAARAWYALRRGVLRRRFGYHALGGSTLLAETVGRLPRVRRLATYLHDAELHPWIAGGRLLEVGCGSGGYLQLMRALGWDVVGVDTSPEAIRVAREVVGLEALVGDIRDLELAGGVFDAVTLAHTLEHVPEPAGALIEVRRLTRSGGRVAIVVPNIRSFGAARFGSDWIGWDQPRHLTNFTPEGLQAILVRAGWTPESVNTTSRAAHLFLRASNAVREGVDLQQAIGLPMPAAPALRARLAVQTLAERVLCGIGRPVGEEILAVARA